MSDIDTAAIGQLLEKQQIHELVMRAARAGDRVDRDLLASCFHTDGSCEFGSLLLEGADAIADAITAAASNCLQTFHLLGNQLVELRGDIAASETYFIGSSVVAGENAGDRLLRMRAGRYVDRIEKRDGSWRIKARTVVEDWSKMLDIPAAAAAAAFRPGKQGKEDFLYTLLGSLPA